MARRTIAQGVLVAVLVLAGSAPVGAQAEPAPEHEEPVTMAQAAAAALVNAIEALPSLIWPDAPAPASLVASVDLARERMWDRAFDRFPWPLHLRFVEARCGSSGGVALVFAEIRPLLPMRTWAVAWRGSMPTSTDDDWAGSTGMPSLLDDPELSRVLGADTVPCP